MEEVVEAHFQEGGEGCLKLAVAAGDYQRTVAREH
jgi:hypothetical protein